MVVLSISICAKNGKILMARQFVEMTRMRLEGLLAAFPKLLGSDNKQHTYIETESVRYVYQQVESLYLIVVTNRASNIVEDLETLKLVSKVLPDILGTSNNITEDKISDHVFELMFALDEVLTAGGYREQTSLAQIRTHLEMDSHEEKLHLMIKKSQMDSAKDKAKDAARAIRAKKQESNLRGIGSSDYDGGNEFNNNRFDSTDTIKPSVPTPTPYQHTPAAAPAPAAKGMLLLAKGGKNKSLEDALYKEDKLAPVIMPTAATEAANEVATIAQGTVAQPITLVATERVSAKLTRDGDVESVEVKGNLTLTAVDDNVALCTLQLSSLPHGSASMYTFNTHPKVNKSLYEQSSLLQLKDTSKGFPSCRPVGILRWSNSIVSMDYVPLTINCWPEEESRNTMSVSIEYTAAGKVPLHDVKIRIPIASTPSIRSIDGSYTHNKAKDELVWEIDLIDSSNSSGSLEFVVAEKDTESFFPITVDFGSMQLFCDVNVVSVSGCSEASGGAAIPFTYTKGMASEQYLIE